MRFQSDSDTLTKADIRELTRESDLAQILAWLEALSEGREHEVVAALMTEKKKKRRKSAEAMRQGYMGGDFHYNELLHQG